MQLLKTGAIALLAGVALLAQPLDAEAGSRKKFHRSNGGEHYDTVMANYIRRCNDLGGQYSRARAERPESAQLAAADALYERGVTHCSDGARMQGIEELTEAIRLIGAIPRVSL